MQKCWQIAIVYYMISREIIEREYLYWALICFIKCWKYYEILHFLCSATFLDKWILYELHKHLAPQIYCHLRFLLTLILRHLF